MPSPLRHCFDYLPPPGVAPERLRPGVRVRVPFGRTRAVGVLLGVSDHSALERGRLRPALELLDERPVLPPAILALLEWTAGYYHHPIGEVLAAALPVLLRQGRAAQPRQALNWCLTEAGRRLDGAALSRAPRQRQLIELLGRSATGLTEAEFDEHIDDWRAVLRRLRDKGWVEAEVLVPSAAAQLEPDARPPLNDAQREAVRAVSAALGGFQAFVLDGVTGSGKTEVYLGIVEAVLAQGRQALLLVPEIGLTPQIVRRFQRRFAQPIAVLHSGLSDQERLNAWLQAAEGGARIVIGTRSAVFAPLPALGLIIVDEEHDASFKQHEGLRYSARDLAVMRARQGAVPVLLGSATPSLESLYNVEQGRYARLHLPERAGAAGHPPVTLLDIRGQRPADGLSQPLLQAMQRQLAQDGQVLLFLNRRGFAPVWMCHACGWVAKCRRCDAHLTVHQRAGRLRCHHCGIERPLDPHCPECGGAELHPLGQGTERIEQALQARFPDTEIVRIDRDSTRRKGAMQALLEQVRAGRRQILVGTQMLAKGHDFPNVTLVGILNADQGLFSVDFRAGERLAQLITQVAGRAGRAERPGEVLIQTHCPEHPLWETLLRRGYPGYAMSALAERRLAELPPYGAMALLRAEAAKAEPPLAFLHEAAQCADALGLPGVQLLGPVPAPMERRAGRVRAQLLLQSQRRADLQRLLAAWVAQLDGLKSARKVRWSLDVDPLDMY